MSAIEWRCACLAAVLLLAAPSARAQQAAPSPIDRAAAQQLFADGRQLFEQGRYSEACEKLAASQSIEPHGGVLLDLAICHEKMGRLATAWVEYSDAVAQARRDGRTDREAFASKRVDELGPRLSRLRIIVPPAIRDQHHPIVRLDGVPVREGAWGAAVPVDPGSHRVEAFAADGRALASIPFVSAPGQVIDVKVAGTEATPPPSGNPSQAPEAPTAQRTTGWILLGVGGLVLGAGAIFGMQAIGKRKDAEECARTACSEGAAELNDSAKRAAWASNGLFVAGIAGVAVGVILLVSARPRQTSSALLDTSTGSVRW